MGRMQLSCKSIKLSVICSRSSLKSKLNDQYSMFKHQPGHISIMTTEPEINFTAILDLHVPLALSVTELHVRSNVTLESTSFALPLQNIRTN